MRQRYCLFRSVSPAFKPATLAPLPEHPGRERHRGANIKQTKPEGRGVLAEIVAIAITY